MEKEPVDFDKFTENYDQLLKERTKVFSPNEAYFAKYKIEIVKNHVTWPISRVLEFGCGIGRNVRYLRETFRCASIMGSDISRESLEKARKENPGVEFFREGESEFSGERFDLIVAAGVYHHIPAAQRLSVSLKLFHRLSSGGTLFVFEHNPFNLITRRVVRSCPYDEGVVLIKLSQLSSLLRKANFWVENYSYCLVFPPYLPRLQRLEGLLGWLPVGGQYWVMAKKLI